jgi:hypothetical protein
MLNSKPSRLSSLSLAATVVYICTAASSVAQTQPVPETRTAAQVETTASRFHPGSDLEFKIKLNEALPQGARFDVRLSPVGLDQELSVSSGEPTNKDRTEFILKTKIPEAAIPGEWHIKVIWLFLAGSSWTSNTLSNNADFGFLVEGPKVPIPTKATAAIINDHR